MLRCDTKTYRRTDIRATRPQQGAVRPARGGVILLVGILMLLLLLPEPVWAAAASAHPLEPLDTSSPRATLTYFLDAYDALGRFYRDTYRKTPSPANWQRMAHMVSRAIRALDLQEIPPAARWETGADRAAMLYDVLSKIELPPEASIPNAAAYTAEEAKRPARWTIPRTEITIARLQEGPRDGAFLFTSETVRRLPEFYRHVRELPDRRQRPLENFYTLRQMVGGWMFPLRFIESLPVWLRTIVFGQAAWKMVVLAVLLILVVAALVFVVHWAYRRPRDRSPGFYFRRLAVPLSTLLCVYVVDYVVNSQLNITGDFSESIDLIAATVTYGAVAWGAWCVALGMAEVLIASPRISEESLDAHLLRMSARLVGLGAFFAFFLYTAQLLGVPLLGLITGAGVFGLAIALAAQDTLRAVLGSITIFLDKPYRVGERVKIMGHDGLIESIGLRSTKIRLLTGHLTSIPNEKMVVTDVENIGRRPYIRRDFNLTLPYDTPPEQITCALDMLRGILAVPEPPAVEAATSANQPQEAPHPNHAINQPGFPPRVYFSEFNADSLNILVIYWYHPADYWAYLAHATWVNLHIMERFKAADIDFAFPTQTLHLAGDAHRPLTVGQQWVSTDAPGSPSTIFTEAAERGVRAAAMAPPDRSIGPSPRPLSDMTDVPLEDEVLHHEDTGEDR
jgi:MscS family membrane protein